MEIKEIIELSTMCITWILGVLAKKYKWISDNLIPIQNILIGLSVALIEFLITKDFKVSIVASGLLAGGVYDVFNNLRKMVSINEE